MRNISLISLSLGLITGLSPTCAATAGKQSLIISRSIISHQFSSFYYSTFASNFQAHSSTFKYFLSASIRVTSLSYSYHTFGVQLTDIFATYFSVYACKFLYINCNEKGAGVFYDRVKPQGGYTVKISYSLFSECSTELNSGAMYLNVPYAGELVLRSNCVYHCKADLNSFAYYLNLPSNAEMGYFAVTRSVNGPSEIKTTDSPNKVSEIYHGQKFALKFTNYSGNTGIVAGIIDFGDNTKSPSEISVTYCYFEKCRARTGILISLISKLTGEKNIAIDYCNFENNDLSYNPTGNERHSLIEGNNDQKVKMKISNCYMIGNHDTTSKTQFNFFVVTETNNASFEINFFDNYITPTPIITGATHNSIVNGPPNKNNIGIKPTCDHKAWSFELEKRPTKQFTQSDRFTLTPSDTFFIPPTATFTLTPSDTFFIAPTATFTLTPSDKFTIAPTSTFSPVPTKSTAKTSLKPPTATSKHVNIPTEAPNHNQTQSKFPLVSKEPTQTKNQIINNQNENQNEVKGKENKTAVITGSVVGGFLFLLLLLLIILFIIYKTSKHAIESDNNEEEDREFETFNDGSDFNQLSDEDEININDNENLNVNDIKEPETIEDNEEEQALPPINPNEIENKDFDGSEKNQDIVAEEDQVYVIPSSLPDKSPEQDQAQELVDPQESELLDPQTQTHEQEEFSFDKDPIQEPETQEIIPLIPSKKRRKKKIETIVEQPETNEFTEDAEISQTTQDFQENIEATEENEIVAPATNRRRKKRRNLEVINSQRRLKIAESTDSLFNNQEFNIDNEQVDENQLATNQEEHTPAPTRGRRLRRKRAQQQTISADFEDELIPEQTFNEHEPETELEVMPTRPKRPRRLKVVPNPLVEEEI